MDDVLEIFDKAPCVHAADLTSMTLADVEQTPGEVIYDVACLHCGRTGAFRIVATDVPVDW